jgi:translocation and assembly module TamB
MPPIDVTVRASLEDGRLTSGLVADGLTDEPIRASVAHPLTLRLQPFVLDIEEDGALDGDIDLAIQLARIADILALDEQILTGTLSADLTLAGTIRAPEVEGPISLQDGVYENSLSGTALRGLTMRANASRERLTVEQLAGRVGNGGTIKAEGWVGLEADFPLSVSVRLDDAELVSRDDAEATLAGDISIEGDLSDALIKGDLLVMRAELSIPEGGGPDLPDIDIEEVGGNIINKPKEEQKEQQEQAFDPKLDISIDLPNQVYVRGRGLESEWQGKLDIEGTASQPLITGNLGVKTGYFDFIDKRFVIERGDIDFNASSPPNPILALAAAATDADFKAIIRLDGPADDPKLTLESEPVLTEDEILARLRFNRELSEIGAVEAAKLALAVNRLRGGGGFDAFAEIRNVLQIDTLDVVGGEEAGDSRVKAGKYLSDEVYLEVEQGTAGDSGRARVEVEILPNVSLEADTGEDSNGGVGLKWRFDY